MASLLDSGTGTNENPLAGNWSGPVFAGDGRIKRETNHFVNAENKWCGAYWSATKFPANQLAQKTVDTISSSRTFELQCRLQNPNSGSINCYYLAVATGGGWELGSVKAGVEATIGTATKAIVVGDKLRLECNGTTIKCIHETSGGVKTTVLEKTNATVTGEGYIGAGMSGTLIGFKEFFGGAIEEGATPTTIPLGAASGVASTSLGLSTPTSVALNASAGVASPTIALSASTQITLAAAAGVASPTAALSAPTRVPLEATAGAGSASASLKAPTQIQLGAASGAASATLTITAQALLVLAATTGIANPTIALRVATQISLGASAGAATASLTLTFESAVTLPRVKLPTTAAIDPYGTTASIDPMELSAEVDPFETGATIDDFETGAEIDDFETSAAIDPFATTAAIDEYVTTADLS